VFYSTEINVAGVFPTRGALLQIRVLICSSRLNAEGKAACAPEVEQTVKDFFPHFSK